MIAFCSVCQTETEHEVAIDHNGETVLTCPHCGHFVKFPDTPTEYQLEEHKTQNKK